jgi:ribosomal protein L29
MAQTSDVIDLAEVRARADEELVALVAAKREESRNARFAREMGQLPKTHVLRQLRRDIARIETVLTTRRRSNQGE